MIVARDDGNLDRTRRLGLDRFTRLVRAEVVHRGKSKPCLRIVRKVFAAAADSTLSTAGVTEHRQAALERMGWTLTDWERARTDQSAVEARMVAVLGQLGLTDLVCSIDGLSAVGAAAILAETGDLRRFTSARAVVKLAGLAPRERLSGTFTGKAPPTQAQTVVAAAILRQLHAVVTTGQAWDPDIAAHGLRLANHVGVVAA